MSDSRVSMKLLDQSIEIESDSPRFIAELRNCFEEPAALPDDVETPDLFVSVDVRPNTHCDSRARRSHFRLVTRPEKALPLTVVREAGAAWSVARALVQWAVDSTRSFYVFHAGSVSRQGRGILLPGPTHSGKSTLTVALAQRGFDVLSDEACAIRVCDGVQTGIDRALSVRAAVIADLGIDGGRGRQVPREAARIFGAGELGLSRASAARPALVVLPAYAEGAAVALRRLRPGAAVMALYRASCSQPHWKLAGLDFVIDLATRLPCFELTYSNMHDAARAIERTFEEACAADRLGP